MTVTVIVNIVINLSDVLIKMVRGVFQIALVLCACVCLSAGDVSHLKTAKAKLIGRFVKGKNHKRGVLSAVPPYKLGYDIPVVTHSVVKPVVVSYPPAAAVTNVKVPLAHPLATRYPVPVGHKVPVPHPHYGLKFPHQTKTVLLRKPDHHFHHHHHHEVPKPVIPVVPAVPTAPVIPVGEPTVTVAHPVPAPSPPLLLQPAPIPAPAPVFPAAGLAHTHLYSQGHTHLKHVVPAAPVPAHPPIAPLLQYANQFQYVLRPGNAVQTSFFANYPRYPFLNYQTPVFPLSQPTPAVNQVLFERPHAPHFHIGPQPGPEGLLYEQPGAHVDAPFLHAHAGIPQHAVHLQPTQPGLHYPGQHDVQLHAAQPEVHLQPGQPEFHLQPGQPEFHLQQGQPEFHLQQGQPEYHLQPGQQEVHLQQGQQEVHLHQGQPEVHFHQAQPEVHLHGAQPGVLQAAQPGVLPTQATVHLQPTQPSLDQDGWHPVQTQPHDVGAQQPGGHFSQDGQFANGAHFGQDGQFAQGGYFGQDGQLAHGGPFGLDGQLAHGGHFGQDGQLAHAGNFGQDGQFGQNGQHQFTQDQGTQVYEQHQGEHQYHDSQNQLQHHIQHQLDQAQYDLHVNNQQPHQQPNQEYGVPQFNQDGFSHSGGQDFSQPGQNFGQQAHDYNQQGQNFGQDFSQAGQNFGQDFSQQQPAAEYGVPQGAEGRSSAEGEEEPPAFHNHIPLMLQPPLDRPLEHFR